jgi:hypothetical protein
MIRGGIKVQLPIPGNASASSTWSGGGYGAEKANDGDPATRWGAATGNRSAWLAIDLGSERSVRSALVDEAGFARIQKYELQAQVNKGWQTIASGTTIEPNKQIVFPAPVKARVFRLNILEANDVPTIGEFQLFE